MPIKIYDSLTKKKVDFAPVEPGKAKIYSCGVTVYDDCHIGHARSLYIFEVIKRYLKYRGFDVTFVRNITDIDDKIINKAKESGISAKEVAEKYIASYYKDLEALGISKADFEPKATENIPEMIKHIEALIEKGFAYEVSGDVYFSVRQFKDYGKLSGQSIDQMLEAVRIEKDPKKKDPLDFALWKKSKDDEPFWESSWGKGRPGWHIECSVMSSKYLNAETLDIHAGGRDLIFPHHENEIAQSEALTGKPFAKYWIHHGLLTINGQKMAKSLGNFITIQDALRQYPSNVLKIFFLQAHYSSPLDFTPEIINACREALDRFNIFFSKINYYRNYVSKMNPSLFQEFKVIIESLKNDFELSMDNDFNTPEAMSKLFQIIYETNIKLYNNSLDINAIELAVNTVKELTGILGLSFEFKEDAFVNFKISEREQARAAKDFKKADTIRQELLEIGIILDDTKDGKTIWRRKI